MATLLSSVDAIRTANPEAGLRSWTSDTRPDAANIVDSERPRSSDLAYERFIIDTPSNTQKAFLAATLLSSLFKIAVKDDAERHAWNINFEHWYRDTLIQKADQSA